MAKRKVKIENEFKTKKFEALKDKWYKKLEQEGFVDVEQDENNLKVWESTAFQNRYDARNAEFTEEYYRLAGQFLYDYNFESEQDRTIWELHSNGYTRTQITAEIKKKKSKKNPVRGKTYIHCKIKTLEKEMLARYGKRNDKPKRTDLN
jgi:hypothetical protein